MNGSQDIEY